MFLTGFLAGIVTVIILIALFMFFSPDKEKEFRESHENMQASLLAYWEKANGNHEEQVLVLRDIANQIRK